MPLLHSVSPLPPPLFIVLNEGSGSDAHEQVRATIAGILDAAGREYRLFVAHGSNIGMVAAEAVAKAEAHPGGSIVVAVGGDGTINTVAQAVLGAGQSLSFGVIPGGTFNYFARAHGIPPDIEAATRLLLTAQPHPVQVGLVNGRVFLVNASLGLYPQLLEDREAWKQKLGRSRLVAFLAGLASLLREQSQLRIRLETDARTRDLRTPTLFVGNNALQLEKIGLPVGEALATGNLVAISVKPISNLALFGLLLRGALGKLGDADAVDFMAFRRLTVRRLGSALPHRRGRTRVATDGEVSWLQTPLIFSVSPQPLRLLKPEGAPAEAAGE